MKKAIVTGGSGYFGNLMINELINRGWSVKNLDINNPNEPITGCEFIKADVRNLNSIPEKVFSGIDCVFHNVALVPITKSEDYRETNVNGTRNIIENSIKNGVKNFVHLSSSAIYGVPESNPVDEKVLPSPAEKYGQSKLDTEIILSAYSKKIDISIIRPRTILGHGRLGIFQILFDWVQRGWNIPVLGDGKNIYQFIHSDDLTNACILASNTSGLNFYNVGSQKYSTMRDTLQALCDYSNTGSKVISIPFETSEFLMNLSSFLKISPLGPYHSLVYGRSLYFNTRKIEKELGWESKYSNEDAIIDSYKNYVQNFTENKFKESFSPHTSYTKQKVIRLFGLLLNLYR